METFYGIIFYLYPMQIPWPLTIEQTHDIFSDMKETGKINIRRLLMADLPDGKSIGFKGFLFLCGALLASAGVILEHPTVKTVLLLAIAIWCSARFYYFMFYVIEHYVDGNYKFSGICSFLAYLFRKRDGGHSAPDK